MITPLFYRFLAVIALTGALFAGAAFAASGTWSGAELIDAGAQNGSIPQIAMDGTGKALAVWVQDDGTGVLHLYARHWDGSAWSAAQIIDTGTHNVSMPQVALDASGNGMAVWVQNDGTQDRIYTNHWDGSAWAAPVNIEGGGAVAVTAPHMALYGNGKGIAMWAQNNSGVYRLYVRHWMGTYWTAVTLIDRGTGYDVTDQQIALDASGTGFAVWRQNDGAAFRIFASRWNGSYWSATSIDAGANWAERPQIAMDGAGKAMAVFEQQDATGTIVRVYANRFDGNAWSGAEPVDAGVNGTAYPQVAFDASGKAVAAWMQYDAPTWRVYANSYDGSAWSSAAAIDTPGNTAAYPHVAMDGSGNAIAIWEEWNGAGTYHLYNRRWHGGAWSDAATIDNAVPGSVWDEQIAMDKSGKAMVVWRQSDGTNNRVYANRFVPAVASGESGGGTGGGTGGGGALGLPLLLALGGMITLRRRRALP